MSGNDLVYMNIALDEARKAKLEGNLPIGAALVIDGEVIGVGRNNQVTDSNFFSHAELKLVEEYASLIQASHNGGKRIEVFTTLEPCLMCFGTMIHNRVGRIIYACPDPLAGASSVSPPTSWYERRWPQIVNNIGRDESYQLLAEYMLEHSDRWERALQQYEEMQREFKKGG